MKIILITGASSGIGRATAEMLLEKPEYRVYATSHDIENMQDLAEHGAHIFKIDVTQTDDISGGIQSIIDAEGRIDVLINNAGYGVYGSIEDTDIDEARKQFDVNVFGLGEMMKMTIPHMRTQGSGHIINIASIAGKIYLPLGAWYHGSKFAVEGMSDCARVELAPFGVKVTMIEPSAIATKFGSRMIPRLLELTVGTAYARQGKRVAELMKGTAKGGGGLPPQKVAETIITAIESSRPRHRYVVGKRGKIFITFKKIFGTRVFDYFLQKGMK